MGNINTKKLTRNAIISALYIALTVINPIGWGAMQFRISEMILMVPFFDRDYIMGAIVGVAIANMYSPLGIIDVIVGILCCVISYYASIKIKNKYINAAIYSLIAGTLVAIELSLVMEIPFVVSMVSISLSTLIVTFLGVWLIQRTKIIKFLSI